MKKIYLILFVFLFPLHSHGSWFKLFTTNTGDLYLKTNSIKREKNRIFFSQMVDYKKKQSNGMLSLKVDSEINCNDLSIRDLKYRTFKNKMGVGKNFYKKKTNMIWKFPKKGTSIYFLNEVLCDRVYIK